MLLFVKYIQNAVEVNENLWYCRENEIFSKKLQDCYLIPIKGESKC